MRQGSSLTRPSQGPFQLCTHLLLLPALPWARHAWPLCVSSGCRGRLGLPSLGRAGYESGASALPTFVSSFSSCLARTTRMTVLKVTVRFYVEGGWLLPAWPPPLRSPLTAPGRGEGRMPAGPGLWHQRVFVPEQERTVCTKAQCLHSHWLLLLAFSAGSSPERKWSSREASRTWPRTEPRAQETGVTAGPQTPSGARPSRNMGPAGRRGAWTPQNVSPPEGAHRDFGVTGLQGVGV